MYVSSVSMLMHGIELVPVCLWAVLIEPQHVFVCLLFLTLKCALLL